jgi:hypothetical protein
MTNLVKGKLVAWTAALAALFMLLVFLIEPRQLIDILNGVFLGVAIAVTMVYGPLLFHTLKHSTFDRVSQLSVGISVLWFAAVLSRAYSAYYRYMGGGDTMLNSPVVSAVSYLCIVAGILFITAAGKKARHSRVACALNSGGKTLLLVFGAIGGLLSFLISQGHLHAG